MSTSYFSMPTNVYVVPVFVSMSKSNDRVLPALRPKLTDSTSSKRMWIGGLWMKMNPRSRGYKKPVAALYEHPTH